MSYPLTLGTFGPTSQPSAFEWSPTRGASSKLSWRGRIDRLLPLCSSLYLAGYSYNITGGNGGIYTLEATVGGDPTGTFNNASPETVDNWELLNNKVQKDILESDNTIVNSLSGADVNDIKDALKNPPTGNSDPAFTNNATNCLKVYNLMAAGVTSVQIFQPTLRHTWIVPRGASIKYEFTNAGKILSTSTLISTEGVPPDFVVSFATLASGSVTRSGVPLSWGWFKSQPSVNITARGSREVHAEWEFGLWATDIYGSLV